ncbi:MAG TPA: Crp/Fnr family transcriptional regulator [Candidatus Baltobacteraceae bacterium]|nr:Crp/Fnr family transcriptional regulator [Candidatus Baltobacteraceae bacterium]
MTDFTSNQVLAELPASSRDAITARLNCETMRPWQLVRNEHEPIDRVYFPIDGVISVVSLMEDGAVAESYTVGRDGMAGSETVWGDERLIFRMICQIPGEFCWIDAREFKAIAHRDPAVMKIVHAYAHCIMALTGRSGACNLLHPVVERCARWLLLCHDRVGKETFELTQEILATMLGVHRPAVSIAAGTLQKAGLITYTRGRITIADRAMLEDASCECYRVVADEFCRVLGGPPPMR